MKLKSLVNLVTLIFTIFLLTACGANGGSNANANGESSEDIEIDLASTLPEEEHSVLFDNLEENLDKNSEGRVEFNLFADGALGGEEEGMKQVSSGEVNMAVGVLHSSIYYPEYDAPGVPYLFSNYDDIFEYMDGPMGEKIDEILLDEANMIQVGYYLSGPRWLTANDPVEKPEDFKRMKIRLSENP